MVLVPIGRGSRGIVRIYSRYYQSTGFKFGRSVEYYRHQLPVRSGFNNQLLSQ
jgi:hypothetical protein